ncbi:M14 family metallocarboxypeptidase [Cytobacillus sp. Hz8]|uniref:M14 family metallopeptidase n=1 Tax=Cytobacillus sp. Hz8 TaxID=3347168 RepID=UPI0035DD73E6
MKKCYFLLVLLFLLTIPTPTKGELVNPNQIYSFSQLETDLNQLQSKYGKHIQVKSIGISHYGRNIWAVRLGKGEQNILMIGAHHGREWLTTSILMKMIEEYAKTYEQGDEYGGNSLQLLDQVSIWFVPMLNPDGVMIQQNGLDEFSFFRRWLLKRMNDGSSNFSRWKANAKGIDLNRQYPVGWKELDSGPKTPFYQFYKGKKPLAAKETVAITKFTKKIKPTIAVAYHSAGREIFWNYKNGKNFERDRKIAEKIAQSTQYRLSQPPKIATGAGYTDWFITTFHLPAMTIEICPYTKETNPPLTYFEEEWKRNQYVGILLIEEASKLISK